VSGRYYRALAIMHQQAQEEIEVASTGPRPDWARVGELKRVKLSIKDRMRSILEEGREDRPRWSVASGVRRHSLRASLSSDA